MRQNSPDFTDTKIDSQMFTTNLEKHLKIIINGSMTALAEHSVRIQKEKTKRIKKKTGGERKREKNKQRTKQKKYCAAE